MIIQILALDQGAAYYAIVAIVLNFSHNIQVQQITI